jgi:microcin C transport system ATP-binding protein
MDVGECVSLLTSLGLDPAVAHSDRYVKQYSSGMQQRVKLAMAFALAPRFIFLDEPSSNLDVAGIERLSRL